MNTHSFKKSLLTISVIYALSTQVCNADIFDELDSETSFDSGFGTPDKMEELEKNASSAFDSLDFETQYGTSSQSKEELDKEFESWKEQYFAELKRYKEDILNIWDEAEVTDKTLWVEYSSDMKTKKVIDYEKNEIRVSIVDDSGSTNEADIQQFVEEIMNTTPNEARKADPVLAAIKADAVIDDSVNNDSLLSELFDEPANNQTVADIPVTKPSAQPIIKQTVEQNNDASRSSDATTTQQQANTTKNTVAIDNATASVEDSNRAQNRNQAETPKDKMVEQLVKTAKIEKAEPQKNPKLSAVTTVTIKLPTKSTLNRAKKYSSYVQSYANKNQLDEALVYAIMHTESAFNPMARSGIPAFGLMQIVPTSAGRDVAKRLYGESRVFEPDYLYNAKNNVEAGSTYLNILMFNYLKKITNLESRMYCAIAAYNTGAGNVSVAFTGNRKLGRAIPIINSKTPQEVYNMLREHLPYEETQTYLERVVKRHQMYAQASL